MARTARNPKLDTRSARARLPQRREPYWTSLQPGAALGYRKSATAGTWIARHYSPEARPKTRYEALGTADDVMDADGTATLSFAQAQSQAREWFTRQARIIAGFEERSNGPYRVRDAMDDYLAWMELHRKSAAETRRTANSLILPDLGDVELVRLTADRIRRWHSGLAAVGRRVRVPKGHAAKTQEFVKDPESIRRRRSTANRILTVLKACLNYAWREGKTPTDTAWRRVRPFPQVDGVRIRYLPTKEAQRFLRACEPSCFRDLAHGGLLTGARYGELVALRVADFDRRNGLVRIAKSKSGKGRHVVLNEEGVRLFARLTKGREPEELIFRRENGAAWNKNHQQRLMQDACTRAGIQPAISFHELRHTWASLALMAGAPHLVVSRNLGHADTRMVEKHYGHLAQSYMADTIRRTAPRFGRFRISRAGAS